MEGVLQGTFPIASGQSEQQNFNPKFKQASLWMVDRSRNSSWAQDLLHVQDTKDVRRAQLGSGSSKSGSGGWEMLTLEDTIVFLEQGAPVQKDEDFVHILHKCRKDKNRAFALRLHAYMQKNGLEVHPLLGNPLVSMLAEAGSISRAHEVFDKLKHRRECSWGSLITGYIRSGDPHRALILYGQMQQDDSIQPSQSTIVAALKACAKLKDQESGRKLHAHVAKRRTLSKDAFVGSALVNMYAKCGSIAEARDVFDKLPVRDAVSWTALITGYAEYGNAEEALKCFEWMELEGVSPDAITYVCSLKACGSLGAIDKGQEIHAQIAQKGKLERHPLVCTALVDMYSRCGHLAKAQEVFDKVLVRNVALWNALLAGYALHGHSHEALSCFEKMQVEGISPNAATFVCSLKACGNIPDIDRGQAIHAQISRIGSLASDIFIGTALVDMYAKCGMLGQAQEAFNKLSVRDVVLWTSLIAGYARHGQGGKALYCFDQMQCEGITPNAVTFVCSLNACASIGAIDKGREIHAEIAQKGQLENDLLVGTALVDMYAKCGWPTKAQEVFDQLAVRDVVSWNALISGYVVHGYGEEALSYLDRMQLECTPPSADTFICGLKACASIGAAHKGLEIHAKISSKGLETDHLVGTALVDMYAKCGLLIQAQELHQNLLIQDVISWNALIAGFSQLGETANVFQTFDRMVSLDTKPNLATFISILNVCCHNGTMDKGEMCLEAMSRDYGILPTLEHVTCIIDLLSRAGQVVKALAIINSMSFHADHVVWHTVLGACRKWGNVEVGRQAFEHSVQLDQKDHAAYVCIYNIYADAGLHNKATKVETTAVR